MAETRTISRSLQHMSHVLRVEAFVGFSDADLVSLFVEFRDDAAFSVLVRRYGVVVLGVCRRILRHEQDAEDAFQATFMILAQKAARIRRTGQLGNWLYGVAFNVARKAKARRHRRELKELEASALKPPICQPSTWNELHELLDRELYTLQEKYRTAIVLCDLKGLSIQQAAAEVGCPPKTLGTRLLRARSMLAERLNQRGLVISASAFGSTISAATANAAIPLRLICSTVHHANTLVANSMVSFSSPVPALTQGVPSLMSLKSLKFIAALACGVLVSIGTLKHFSVTASPLPNKQRLDSGNAEGLQQTRTEPPAAHNPLKHIHQFFVHVHSLFVSDFAESNASTNEQSEDKKEEKTKPALSGNWERAEGEIEFKLAFSDKNAFKIAVKHGDKSGTIACEYTLEKDDLVKAKITEVTGLGEAKEQLPVGAEFMFKWKVKGEKATIEDVEAERIPIMKHLEGKYEKMK